MKTVFSIQRGYSGREVNAIINSAHKLGAEYRWDLPAKEGTIPIGPVEYCEPLFGEHEKRFYPKFLRQYMRRPVCPAKVTEHTLKFHTDLFVKDRGNWKSNFRSQVVSGGTLNKPVEISVPVDKIYIVGIVNFVQEWRYYVADSSVVTTGWYLGDNDDEAAPSLDISWPPGFSGAVDFGRLDTGEIALVECHAPFACGWYGEDHEDYALWQAIAWECSDWWRNPE